MAELVKGVNGDWPDYSSDWRRRRIAYLEGELRRIAHGAWSQPTVDSESASTYARIACEMQNIATLALTAHVE